MNITMDTFQQDVLEADQPVLVDFWGDDCAICNALSPIIDALSEEWEAVKVVKMWLSPDMPLVQQYGIQGIPTLILFKDGKPVKRASGFHSKEAILSRFG